MENTYISDHFWSAVKRKNLPDVLEIVFAQSGFEEAAKVAHETNAMTNAAIERMKTALGGHLEQDLLPLAEEVETILPPVNDKQTAEGNELIAIHEDIENLLAKGKGKKAKKLIKASMANGTKGSVIAKQLKQAKKLIKKEA